MKGRSMFTIGLPYFTIKDRKKIEGSGDKKMEYFTVIPAAGAGKRMGAEKNKLLLSINGEPIIAHTIRVFEKDEWCKGIVLVVSRTDESNMKKLVEEYQFQKIHSIVIGGVERQHSVYEGLKALRDFINPIVLIHDGARPLVKKKAIHELVQVTDDKGAAILAVPVKDTIKVAKDGKVSKTLDRSTLWSVQTPQAFRLSEILTAHEKAEKRGIIATDDAALMEELGKDVAIVEGDYENIKITTPEDLKIAEMILEQEKEM